MCLLCGEGMVVRGVLIVCDVWGSCIVSTVESIYCDHSAATCTVLQPGQEMTDVDRFYRGVEYFTIPLHYPPALLPQAVLSLPSCCRSLLESTESLSWLCHTLSSPVSSTLEWWMSSLGESRGPSTGVPSLTFISTSTRLPAHKLPSLSPTSPAVGSSWLAPWPGGPT